MTYPVLLIFSIVMGACIGSFLNVVIYRLPEGLAVWKPLFSFCPKCKHQLAGQDNIPVLAWFWLKGKCRYCAAPISIQYPAIEAVCAVLFGLITWAYYGSVLRPEFRSLNEPLNAALPYTATVLVVHLALVSALLAATVIDFRLYIIPISIPNTIIVLALIALPVSAWLTPPHVVSSHPAWPALDGPLAWGAIGALLGVGLANALVHLGVMPRSFDDDMEAHDQVAGAESSGDATKPHDAAPLSNDTPAAVTANATSTGTPVQSGDVSAAPKAPNPESPEDWLEHENLPRELLKETLFLAFPIVGLIVGCLLAARVPAVRDFQLPVALKVLAGVAGGYIVGGGLIWVTRVAGSFVFRKEAMGLGDVHLLGAIGAALGPVEAVLVFFIAPFLGLAYAAIAFGASRIMQGKVRIIPYGPYLAGAAVIVMVFRDHLLRLSGIFS